jgi:hypothetical protein
MRRSSCTHVHILPMGRISSPVAGFSRDPTAIRLRSLDNQTLGCDHDRVIHRQHPGHEVDIGPAKCTQFAPAQAGQSCKPEQWSWARVPSLGGFDDLADHLQGRCLHSFLSDPWRLRHLNDVRANPSPYHSLMECSRDNCVMIADRLRRLALNHSLRRTRSRDSWPSDES